MSVVTMKVTNAHPGDLKTHLSFSAYLSHHALEKTPHQFHHVLWK